MWVYVLNNECVPRFKWDTMLPRPRSVFEDAADGARAPVPTGVLDGLGGPPPPPRTKEEKMERFMDGMIQIQKQQTLATFRVASALARMDESKEIMSFDLALQDFENVNDKIEKVEELADAYRRG